MEIDKNSLHFRLYNSYASGTVWDLEHGRMNFCQYSRKVMLGVFMAIVVMLLGLAFGLGLMQGIGTVGLWLFTDNPFIPFITTYDGFLGAMGTIGMAALIVELIIVVSMTVGYPVMKLKEAGYLSFERDQNREPGFIQTWYASWKEKYCPVVTLKEK